MARFRLPFGRLDARRDGPSRNRREPDVREGDRDSDTPQAAVGTDFTNVENMREELFPQEFPEGAYGAPEDAAAVEGDAGNGTPADGDLREEEEEPFDPRMVFFFDGA